MKQWFTQDNRPNCGTEKLLAARWLAVDGKSLTGRAVVVALRGVENRHATDVQLTDEQQVLHARLLLHARQLERQVSARR